MGEFGPLTQHAYVFAQKDDINGLVKEKNALKDEKDALKKENDEMKKEIEALKEEAKAHKTAIAGLQSDLEKAGVATETQEQLGFTDTGQYHGRSRLSDLALTFHGSRQDARWVCLNVVRSLNAVLIIQRRVPGEIKADEVTEAGR